jgi:hypothetical protein
MRIADIMDDIAARLRSIAAFREVAEYPKGSVTPPAAVVTYPEDYTPHAAYARGADKLTIPVFVAVGKATERASRDLLSDFCDGSGASSVIAVLESGTYTAFDSLTVSNVDFDVVSIGGTDYIAAVFDCDIVGRGA